MHCPDDVSENKIPHKTHINSLYIWNMWRPSLKTCANFHTRLDTLDLSIMIKCYKMSKVFFFWHYRPAWMRLHEMFHITFKTANQLPFIFFEGSLMLWFCSCYQNFFSFICRKGCHFSCLMFSVRLFDSRSWKSFKWVFGNIFLHNLK